MSSIGKITPSMDNYDYPPIPQEELVSSRNVAKQNNITAKTEI
jgi:hypothetical protein